MKLIKAVQEVVEGKQYVCGALHPTDKNWEVWDVMDWDAEDQVFYKGGDLFDEGTPFDYFRYVYELPSLKD